MRTVCLAMALLIPALSAQAGTRGTDYALACQFEVSPAGSYEYPAGVSAPVVVPGRDGTQAGADALNACIRAKSAMASGPIVTTTPSGAVKTSRTVGNRTTTTYNLGYGDTAATPVPRTVRHRARFSNRMGECALTFSGGAGYRCADTARRYWP